MGKQRFEVELTHIYGETVYVEAENREEAERLAAASLFDMLDMQTVWDHGTARIEVAKVPTAEEDLEPDFDTYAKDSETGKLEFQRRYEAEE